MTTNRQKETFDAWLKQHQALLFKVVRAFAFNNADQDDLFQEIAIQVWNSIPKFQQRSAVTTWLYRISLNTAITWTKKEHKHQKGRQDIQNMEHLLKEDKDMDSRLVWLYEEISKLNEIERSVTLLMMDGFSYKEIAEILGITTSNVGVKINRIKKQLIL
ncbi:MAG: RNA polymerase sigma factor, partial [Cyclobacteriaceae bacterium]|nr:RNA polymerase sigma factor [Cyclobacteriaceae bacterium]